MSDGENCVSKAQSQRKEDNLAGVLGTRCTVIIERQEKWIGKHMDKMITFLNSCVHCLAHERVSSLRPETAFHL